MGPAPGTDEGKGKGACGFDRARALPSFTQGFCLTLCAWINEQFPEERA